MITAMTTIILILIALAFVATIAEMLREVFQDRPSSVPRSHREDPGFRSPAAWC